VQAVFPRSSYQLAAKICAAIQVLIGVFVLFGWAAKVPLLTTILPGRITMKPNTATGFLFLGLSLLFILTPQLLRSYRSLSVGLAISVIMIGALTLCEYAFHADLHIDQLLFRDFLQFPYPGRMAHITAINFCVAGLAVLLFSLSERQAKWPQLLASLVGLTAFLAIIGYVYGVPLLYGSLQYTSMALHTGLGFLACSLAILCCRPEHGCMSTLTSRYSGGWLARKLVPIALLVPGAIGLIFMQSGLFKYDLRFGVAALMVSQSVLFVVLIAALAYVLNRSENRRASADEALQQSEKLLQQSQKMEAVGLLAGGVAHDFNNALGVMMGYGELILMKVSNDSTMRGHAEGIVAAGRRAAALTRQLLAFSRKEVMQPVVLDLNARVRDIEKMLRRLIGENIEIRFKPEARIGRVNADPGQIDQVLMNIAVNARDAMPHGGVLSIETSNVELDEIAVRQHPQATTGSYVVLSISDNGCGMDKNTLSQIFEPFFTTKESGKGTGLGLSTVYGIVKQNKGHVGVYSELARGTTFKIYLPRIADGVSATAEGTQTSTPLPRGIETILVVEDEEPLRKIACTCLENGGYTVLEAPSSAAAVEIAQNYGGKIHLLLSDVIMPGLCGPELAQKIQSVRKDIHVLYMSGYTNDLIAQHGVLDEDTLLVEKPFTFNSLLSKVQIALHGAKKAAAAGGR
jgi:signal transduction histidine kinase/ActR/RegA family two-component response regulator